MLRVRHLFLSIPVRAVWMIILTLLMSVSTAGLSVRNPVNAQDQTPETVVSVLQVVETTPAEGEELGLDQPITLYFDRDLDCATVTGAAQVTDEQGAVIAGEFACKGTVLTFTPSSALARGSVVTLTVSDSLRGESGAQLLEPFTLVLQTSGFLRVTNALPTEGATEVRTDTTLTLMFNRPVVPLGLPSDAPDLPVPVSIEPAIEGTGEWLNTSIYTFTPAIAWAGGTTYTVTVDDLVAVDGAALAEPYTLTFSTISPLVVSTVPVDQTSKVALRPNIQFTFNQPMDRASVEASFYLRPEETGAATPPGTYTWNDNGDGFMYEPDDLLAMNVPYEFGFPADSAYEIGGRVALPPYRAVFVTVPPPAVVGSDPIDGSTFANPYGFTIFFASPMNPETLNERVVVTPELYDTPDFFYREWDDGLSISFPLEPSTDYTVTLEAGAEDVYGNVIESPFTFSFQTGPYGSEVNLQIPGGPVGFYDSEREKTEVFVTHRNVTQLDLQLYSVPLLDFIGALNSNNYYSLSYDYQPRPDALLNMWSIPSVAPPNVLRYEKLDLGSPQGMNSTAGAVGGPVVCEGAIPSRAKVGDQGTAIAEPNLRARAFPPNGDIIDLLYPGYAFDIVGGPMCINSLVWWQIRLRDGQEAWVAEGLDDEYFFDITLSAQQTAVPLPSVELDGGSLPQGVYYLSVTTPEFADGGFGKMNQVMVVGNANLVVKSSIDAATVWVTDIRSGQPVAGVEVSLHVRGRNPVAATTDAEGIAQFQIDRLSDLYVPLVAVVDAGEYFGMGYSEWSDGIAPWSFNVNYSFYPRRYQVYMYTERPIYRPGQPVYFKGIVRQKRDVIYTPPSDLTTVPVTIFDSNGTEVYNESLPLTEFGSFSGLFELAEDTGLGYYSINVQLPSDTENYTEGGSTSFDVAEYRVPEFQVMVDTPVEEVVQGDTIPVDIDTTFFFGGPVANADVSYYVSTANYFFDRYEGQGRYDFYDLTSDEESENFGFSPFFSEQITSGEGTTDALGNLHIEIPAEYGRSSLSQTFTIEASVLDETGQSVSGRTQVIVHQGEVYLGVGADQYVGTAGDSMTVNVLSVDWEGDALPNQAVEYTVVERRWSSVQTLDRISGQITYDYDIEEIPVADGTLSTGDDGKAAFDFVPPNGGVYQATVTTTDGAGNQIVAATTMWVSDTDYVAWRISNDRRTELIADRETYDVGDTAEILITSPFQGEIQALITIERGGLLSTDVVTMESNSLVYTIPIEEAFAPNVFVGVLLVKGVDETNPVADFRAGMVQLQVSNERLALNIDVQPDCELVGPRETVNYTLTTTDWQGQPVSAELGVALSDLASLSIAEPRTGPILDFFYGLQELSVRTSTALTINTDILTQFTIDVIKGGGGGGGDFGIFEIREEFIDTAFWDAAIVTDAETGQATIEVTLPDNLTTWRLDARGVTLGQDRQMLAGQTALDVISTKPVIVRPVTPRFFVVDDAVTLASVVNNNTNDDLEVSASIEAVGVTLDGETVQTITIPAHSTHRFEWPVTVENSDFVELIFYASANNGDYTDATRPQVGQGDDRLLPVYKYEAPEIVGTGGVLRVSADNAVGVEEAIVLPRRFDVTEGEVTLKLEPSLAASALEALDYFENCRCENTEATVSKFLPNVATFRALSQLNVNSSDLENNLNFEINLAMQRLASQQHSDGGWGWYVQAPSDTLVTAYAVIGLTEARVAGLPVDGSIISRAGLYLQERFQNPGNNLQPNTTPFYDRQAFIAYALGKVGLDEIGGLSNLYDSRDNLSLYAKALLALALYDANPDDTNRINTLMDDIFTAAIVSANGAHWEETGRDYYNWNTHTRTTAIILKALATLRPDNELVPNVVRWLMTARTADAWETTQETAWAVMALTDWMTASAELTASYTYSAQLNGAEIVSGTAESESLSEAVSVQVPVTDLLRDEVNRLLIETAAGTGSLYYTAYLRAFLPVPAIEPLDRGIVVQRQYTLLGDESKTPITEAHVGDLVQVRLTIIAPNDLHYVVIEDPLPAGAEGINPDLAISQQTGTDPGVDSVNQGEGDDPLSRWWGWWYFENIAFEDERVVLNATYLPAGTYEYVYTMRPSVEGTFNVIPPNGREYYFPEVFGRGAGSTFTVLPPSGQAQ